MYSSSKLSYADSCKSITRPVHTTCYSWQYLGLLSFLLLAPLLSPQHHLFLQRNGRMCSVVLLRSSAACGECGQSLYAASWKMCVPLKKWSAEKRVLVRLFQPALLHCAQGLKCLVSNTFWDLHFFCWRNATCCSYPRSPEEQGRWRWLSVLFMQFGVCYWKWQ